MTMLSAVGGPVSVSARPSARLWLLAAVELAAAALVAKLMVPSSQRASTVEHHDMHGMPGMTESIPPAPHWDWVEGTTLGVALAAFVRWGRSKHPIAAVCTAAGLVVLAASQPVRVLATQSHLVAMTALKILLVLVPLLMLAALPARRIQAEQRSGSRGLWTLLTGVAAMLYAGLVLVIHLPPLHHRSAEIGMVPLWVPGVLTLVGCFYWTAHIAHRRARNAQRPSGRVTGRPGIDGFRRPFGDLRSLDIDESC
jgi:uncharacterized membrane protein YhaH (DUF805 family)